MADMQRKQEVWLVHICNKRTGETVVYRHLFGFREEGGDRDTFIWGDGNYSCDCNRGIFFHEAKGEKHADHPCSSTPDTVVFLIPRIVVEATGEVIYSEEFPA
jgi:hypothetical protein